VEEKMRTVKLIMSESPMELPMMDVSAITRKRLDVDYTPDNPHPARTLDIYYPETGDGPFPTIISIHGGAFIAGEKGDRQVAGFVDGVGYGFAVASVEQRLCTPLPDGGYSEEGLFPNPLCDFKAAIRFLRANAREYMLDPNRFATAGDSAGGWHAIMAALTPDIPALYDSALGHNDVDGSVQAVVSWFGVGDLTMNVEFGEQHPVMKMPGDILVEREIYFEDIFLGVPTTKHRNIARLAAPEQWVTKDAPPVLLQHGTDDDAVTIENARSIAGKIREVCGPDHATLDEFEGYLHGDERFYDDENLERVFAWLKETLIDSSR
jgi:acetyl esterase/lipase